MSFAFGLPAPLPLGGVGTFDLALFGSVFALTFVAELPDKTAFATLLLATRANPWAIFIGAAAAFVVQTVIAVAFGRLVGLLPPHLIQLASGLLFIVLALVMWLRKEAAEEELDLASSPGRFLRTIWISFLVFFVAEWGVLSQISTAILAARHGQGALLTIFLAATLALWTVTALAILVGNRAKKAVRPKVLQRIAAIAFAVVGALLLAGFGWPSR